MTWYQKNRIGKYNNKTNIYNGQIYDSILESEYARELDIRKKAGEIEDWERQVKVSIDWNGYHICNYFVDFLIHYKDGTREFVEIKGFSTDTFRLKWKCFEAIYGDLPDTKLTIIKQVSNWKAKLGSYNKNKKKK